MVTAKILKTCKDVSLPAGPSHLEWPGSIKVATNWSRARSGSGHVQRPLQAAHTKYFSTRNSDNASARVAWRISGAFELLIESSSSSQAITASDGDARASGPVKVAGPGADSNFGYTFSGTSYGARKVPCSILLASSSPTILSVAASKLIVRPSR